ncbi:MAG: hypothetical protein ONB30_07120, partial [candidate division KSB1 bacterium]|nr:hypothetical protein [candidate division KSB1 bacterium]
MVRSQNLVEQALPLRSASAGWKFAHPRLLWSKGDWVPQQQPAHPGRVRCHSLGEEHFQKAWAHPAPHAGFGT